jgi:hypothetical protein
MYYLDIIECIMYRSMVNQVKWVSVQNKNCARYQKLKWQKEV